MYTSSNSSYLLPPVTPSLYSPIFSLCQKTPHILNHIVLSLFTTLIYEYIIPYVISITFIPFHSPINFHKFSFYYLASIPLHMTSLCMTTLRSHKLIYLCIQIIWKSLTLSMGCILLTTL